jgi:integrase
MARQATGQVVERRGGHRHTFALRYRVPGHGRVYETLGGAPEWDRARAEEELERRRAQIKLGIWQPRRPVESAAAAGAAEVPTFWTFAERWYEQKELEVDERTREHWLYLLNKHLIFFGAYRVNEITEDLVDEYRAAKLREGRLSPTTINKTLRLLARILDKAVRAKFLETNPARGEDSRLDEPTPRRIWLELDEVRSLLDAGGDYRRELATLMLAGLRISELGGLHWRAVDLPKGTLTVEESKTEAGEGRVIDMTPMLISELKLHRAQHPKAKPDDLVFPTRKGRPRDRSNSRGRLKTILKRANAARKESGLAPIAAITNHTMRRTYMSLMYDAGATPPEVMEQVGHKSAKLALEVYARKIKRDRETGKRMDALVNGHSVGTNSEPAYGPLSDKEMEVSV